MNAETDGPGSLRDMELEVEAEGREWMRRRLEQNLQAQANRHGGVFPQSGRKAQRGGLGRARQVLAVAAGAPWIWNVVGDRWSGAHQLLDFYHASKHLWTLGQAFHPEERGGPPGLGGDATASHAAMPAPAPRSVLAEGGLRHLDALEEARANGHWEELWLTA